MAQSHNDVDGSLPRAILRISEEIIRRILQKQAKITITILGKLFTEHIGESNFANLNRIICDFGAETRQEWGPFVKGIEGVQECHRLKTKVILQGSFGFVKMHREVLGIFSIEDYQLILLVEAINCLLGKKEINARMQNSNTVLHLIASFPVMSDRENQWVCGLLNLLLDARADISLKNDQEIPAPHLIAGNYWLEPNNGYIISKSRCPTIRENTLGRCKKLEIIFERRDLYGSVLRGKIGNSILHEWVLYCANYVVTMTKEERTLGLFIMPSNHSLDLVNDVGCTPLHYAFTSELVDFLCFAGCAIDRKNVEGDTPLINIIKETLLHSVLKLTEIDNRAGFCFEGYAIRPYEQIKVNASNNGQLGINNLSLDVFERNNFDLSSSDKSSKTCLDYILMFVAFALRDLDKISRLSLNFIVDVIEKWVMPLCTLNGSEAMEKALQSLIIVFFKIGEEEQMCSQVLSFIEKLLESDVNPNGVRFEQGDGIIHYCLKRSNQTKVPRHLLSKIVKLLCENGADRRSHPINLSVSEDILNIVKDTKQKRRVKALEIQSVRYKEELDSLSREKCPCKVSESCRYLKDIIIGEGACSSIYLSIDEKTAREMALKRMEKHYFLKEVRTEIDALKRLEQNLNIVNFYDFLQCEEFCYLALELMDGDLNELVAQHDKFLKKPETITRLSADIVRGLAFLHENKMIHRDLKPGNVLYRELPELCLKLADFGLAKIIDRGSFESQSTLLATTASTSLCGTRGWMSPEIIRRDQKEHNEQSDMFALGLVLYFLFSKGYHPFHIGSKLSEAIASSSLRLDKLETNISNPINQELKDNLVKVLTPEQNNLILLLLSHNPAHRPSSRGLLKEHCCFWTNLKKVKFIWSIGDQPEIAVQKKSKIADSLEKTPFGSRIEKTGWNQHFTDLYKEMPKGKYKTHSFTSLIRFFRNAYAHYEERSQERKEELLKDAFFVKFPSFFITVWMEVGRHGWMEEESGKDWLLRLIKEMD